MANGSRRLRGRRPPSQTPGGGNYGEKWHQKLDYLDKPKRGKPREIRMVGGMFTLYQHYVKFKRPKDGSNSGFYEVCPDFDWETGEFRKGPDACCPLCAEFQEQDLPRELQMFGSFRYYFDVFDITGITAGNVEGVFGVVFSNKYGKNDLANIKDIVGHDVDDDDNGFTVHWHNDDNASDAKDRTRFYQGRKIPVGYDEDKGVFVLSGKGKRFIGEPTDFAEIVQVRSSDEIRHDLKRLGLYAKLSEVMEVQSARDPIGSQGSVVSDPNAGGNWGGGSQQPQQQQQPQQPQQQQQQQPQQQQQQPQQQQQQQQAAPPADDGWGDSSGGSVETPPANDGWGTDTGSSAAAPAADDGWGDSGSTAAAPAETAPAADDGWGDAGASSSGNGSGSTPDANTGSDFDDSLFSSGDSSGSSDDGWGDSSSSDKSDSKKESTPAADPDGW